MTVWNFTVFEHDSSRPWIVVKSSRDTVELKDGDDFWSWASQRWPGSQFRVELDPGQETRWRLLRS